MSVKRVKVIRGFYFNGEPSWPNSVVELPERFALEVVRSNKAEFVKDDAKLLDAPAPPPRDLSLPAAAAAKA